MKTVLVTGASRNIGADIARRFAAGGYQVALNATRPDDIGPIAAEINGSGGRAMAVPGDVRDPADVERMVAEVAGELGAVDVLVNNAVLRRHSVIAETSFEDWQAVLDVVLTGTFNCTKAVLPHMREQRWGRIINMGGVAGQRGAIGRPAVVAAKSGVIGFTKAAALETAAEGVTINVLSPGIIATDRGDLGRIGDEAVVRTHYDEEQAAIPVGRLGTLGEVSSVCFFLASEEASFITGQVIGVNGGRYM